MQHTGPLKAQRDNVVILLYYFSCFYQTCRLLKPSAKQQFLTHVFPLRIPGNWVCAATIRFAFVPSAFFIIIFLWLKVLVTGQEAAFWRDSSATVEGVLLHSTSQMWFATSQSACLPTWHPQGFVLCCLSGGLAIPFFLYTHTYTHSHSHRHIVCLVRAFIYAAL